MKIKLLLIAITMGLSIPAFAEITFIENGYEVWLDEVRLPRNDGGTIAYKPCETCDYETSRVATDIRWEIDGQSMTLEQFRRSAEALSGNKQVVLVTQNIKSKQITYVSLVVVREIE